MSRAAVFFSSALFLASCATPPRRPAGPARRAAVPAAPAATAAPEPPKPEKVSSDQTTPVVISPLANLNDFSLIANGGFDPGWRVGYDAAWVIQLPPAPAGPWKRAFVGAKLGRAKLEPVPGRPSWAEKRRVKGEVDIALAGEPLWPHSRRQLLANLGDIPLEGDPDNAVDGVGEARWFWVEVSLKHVSFDKPNFIALYSPSESLKDAETRAPVLAAGPRSALLPGVNTWLSAGTRGQPPLGTSEAFKTPVKTFAPAVALKLVPADEAEVKVVLGASPEKGQVVTAPFLVGASIQGADVSRAWVEVSTDTHKWRNASPVLLTPPYLFTLRPGDLPAGELWWRISAVDAWETRGDSAPREVIVPERKK